MDNSDEQNINETLDELLEGVLSSPETDIYPSRMKKKLPKQQKASKRRNHTMENGPSTSKTKKRKETTKDRLLEWNNFYSEKKFGIWIQCTKCNKWRKVLDFEEQHEVPTDWCCSMSKSGIKSCEAPENFDDIDISPVDFVPGSIVWAKLDGYPWWPAMVEDDPDIEEYFWIENNGKYTYNVTFLDEKVTHAWVLASYVRSFLNPPPQPRHLGNKYIKTRHTELIAAAKEKAELALTMSIKDRLKNFSFAQRYNGKWPLAHSEDEEATEDITQMLIEQLEDIDSDELPFELDDTTNSSNEQVENKKEKPLPKKRNFNSKQTVCLKSSNNNLSSEFCSTINLSNNLVEEEETEDIYYENPNYISRKEGINSVKSKGKKMNALNNKTHQKNVNMPQTSATESNIDKTMDKIKSLSKTITESWTKEVKEQKIHLTKNKTIKSLDKASVPENKQEDNALNYHEKTSPQRKAKIDKTKNPPKKAKGKFAKETELDKALKENLKPVEKQLSKTNKPSFKPPVREIQNNKCEEIKNEILNMGKADKNMQHMHIQDTGKESIDISGKSITDDAPNSLEKHTDEEMNPHENLECVSANTNSATCDYSESREIPEKNNGRSLEGEDKAEIEQMNSSNITELKDVENKKNTSDQKMVQDYYSHLRENKLKMNKTETLGKGLTKSADEKKENEVKPGKKSNASKEKVEVQVEDKHFCEPNIKKNIVSNENHSSQHEIEEGMANLEARNKSTNKRQKAKMTMPQGKEEEVTKILKKYLKSSMKIKPASSSTAKNSEITSNSNCSIAQEIDSENQKKNAIDDEYKNHEDGIKQNKSKTIVKSVKTPKLKSPSTEYKKCSAQNNLPKMKSSIKDIVNFKPKVEEQNKKLHTSPENSGHEVDKKNCGKNKQKSGLVKNADRNRKSIMEVPFYDYDKPENKKNTAKKTTEEGMEDSENEKNCFSLSVNMDIEQAEEEDSDPFEAE